MVKIMTPLEKYKRDLERPDFSYDVAQERAVTHLDRLYYDLVTRQKSKPKGVFAKFSGKTKAAENKPAMGLYFLGWSWARQNLFG